MAIYLSVAHLTGKESEFVKEAFDSGWITTVGPQLDRFEEELQAALRTRKKVVAVASGTAAIHLGLVRLGVGYGDEVICQDFTFAAGVNPVKYAGAAPVLVGSEDKTWNLSPQYLEKAIKDRIKVTGKKPKAIIPTDLYGMPALFPEITEIADHYGIPVLEDAAEALGSYIAVSGDQIQYCGTFGEYGCLSFNGNKIITTSGGGALICPGEEEAEAVRFLSTQARDKAPHYQHSQLGYNYRLSNVCAAVGLGQITSLKEYVQRRRAIFQLYYNELKDIAGGFQPEPSGYFSNRWLTTVLFSSFEEREQVRLSLESQQIETRPLWKPMHLQPLYASVPYYGEKYEELLFEKGLCLPSGSILTDEQIIYVCKQIKLTLKS